MLKNKFNEMNTNCQNDTTQTRSHSKVPFMITNICAGFRTETKHYSKWYPCESYCNVKSSFGQDEFSKGSWSVPVQINVKY